MTKPKKFSRKELAKVQVDILKEQGRLFLQCQTCGTIWLLPITKLGKLRPNYWVCPNQQQHGSMVTKQEVAYHEAGHAVVGHLLGIPIDYATIIPQYNVAGQVSYTINLGKLPPSQQVMITLAGPIAEDMVTTSPRFQSFEDLMYHSESDGRGVLAIIERHQHEVDIPAHYDVAKYLLTKHRQAVERVASALLKHGQLPGEDVAKIISNPT